MKNIIFIFVFSSSIFFSYSQELNLKKKQNIIDNGLVESYFVLKNNKKIKQGEYELKYNGKTIQKGSYSNNIKTGDWYYFNPNSKLDFIYNYDSLAIVSDTVGKDRLPFYSEGSGYFFYLISTAKV